MKIKVNLYYIIIRSHWGIHGYFKLIRGEGTPNLNIEDDCHFGVPLDTWTDDLRNTTEPE